MEIVAAGAEVGARKSHERQTGAVGAAADRADDGGNAKLSHRFRGMMDQMHVRQDPVLHIIIRIFYGNTKSVFPIFII